jgi:malonate transporter and related proteins
LIFSHDGLFLVAWRLLPRVTPLQGPGPIIYAVLLLATSATPVFGIAVLLGDTSAGTVGLVALAINLVVPAAIILLEMSSPGAGAASAASRGVQAARFCPG